VLLLYFAFSASILVIRLVNSFCVVFNFVIYVGVNTTVLFVVVVGVAANIGAALANMVSTQNVAINSFFITISPPIPKVPHIMGL
jgi:hypothetical protein